MERDTAHIISLGAGVQSSTMALMAAAGEIIPMPKAAIFADTTYEPAEVYEWLEFLESRLPFPVYRSTATESQLKIINYGQVQIPVHVAAGFGKRQCTSHWKIVPIQRKLREILNLRKKILKHIVVTSWIGISLDEVHRMKPNREKWIENRWPLIEKRITRHECLRWMQQNGFQKPPKSACVFCPYKSNAHWRQTKKDPTQMKIVREVEEMLPKGSFLHSSKQRIDDVDLSTDFDRGQMSLFGNECEGMCGV